MYFLLCKKRKRAGALARTGPELVQIRASGVNARLLQLLPYAVSGMRHVEVRHAQVCKSVHHGAGKGGDAAYVRRLGHAFGADGVVRRRRYRVVSFPMRRFHRGRQEIVHQRVTLDIALLVKGQ